jgi:hypothetical protein
MNAELESRIARLEQQVAELLQENERLRTAAIAPDAHVGRRDVLLGAAAVVGTAGLSLVGTRPASAASGTMQYGTGSYQNSGTTYTGLQSTNVLYTLGIANYAEAPENERFGNGIAASSAHGSAGRLLTDTTSSGHGLFAEARGTGHAVHASKGSPEANANKTGHAVLATQNSTTSTYAAVLGVTKGSGAGLQGRGEGTGYGVWGEIADSALAQSAVVGSTEGGGAGVEGISIRGRGGQFTGSKAQVRLLPSNRKTKPSTGKRGDLFVDASGRLWYCKTGASTTGWVQLA